MLKVGDVISLKEKAQKLSKNMESLAVLKSRADRVNPAEMSIKVVALPT